MIYFCRVTNHMLMPNHDNWNIIEKFIAFPFQLHLGEASLKICKILGQCPRWGGAQKCPNFNLVIFKMEGGVSIFHNNKTLYTV